MTVLAILPARYGSTRFPGKPLTPIAGKPMIQHVWERTRFAKAVDAVVIATDDERGLFRRDWTRMLSGASLPTIVR